MTRVRKAARYSASPSGGFRPPDQAMLTLKPSPSSAPHCEQSRLKIDRIERKKGRRRQSIKGETKGVRRKEKKGYFYLVRIARAREEMAVVMPVDRYVEDARIVVKDLLRAVAMMNVLFKPPPPYRASKGKEN